MQVSNMQHRVTGRSVFTGVKAAKQNTGTVHVHLRKAKLHTKPRRGAELASHDRVVDFVPHAIALIESEDEHLAYRREQNVTQM